jgi:hypothetical protein
VVVAVGVDVGVDAGVSKLKVIFISEKVEERTASTEQNSAAFASVGQQCLIKEQGTTAENMLSR